MVVSSAPPSEKTETWPIQSANKVTESALMAGMRRPVTTEVVAYDSRALFPEQPDRVADVVIKWRRRLFSRKTT
jgi:hypothetical protein